jgi:hypothetical protein
MKSTIAAETTYLLDRGVDHVRFDMHRPVARAVRFAILSRHGVLAHVPSPCHAISAPAESPDGIARGATLGIATNTHMASISPNGHAPCRNP